MKYFILSLIILLSITSSKSQKLSLGPELGINIIPLESTDIGTNFHLGYHFGGHWCSTPAPRWWGRIFNIVESHMHWFFYFVCHWIFCLKASDTYVEEENFLIFRVLLYGSVSASVCISNHAERQLTKTDVSSLGRGA